MIEKVDYQKIYEHLKNDKPRYTSASEIAEFIGVPRIYGGTMRKLVNDGYLMKTMKRGRYINLKNEKNSKYAEFLNSINIF